MLINILLVIGAYVFMEFMAWFTHKYIMHGILWDWHEDHHLPEHKKQGFFERNDRFFLVFAVPSATCFILGSFIENYFFLVFIGLGILLYGVTYFLIHDVYIHRRFSWFKHLDNPYSRAILKAHGAHHAKETKEDCESFGLLVVHPKFFKIKRIRPESTGE
ncbi:MAG: sterol desaturase family protein [Saprospiraceae bacterium]|nr:sterol desaturase family protein [Saprospiraceae bacterium]